MNIQYTVDTLPDNYKNYSEIGTDDNGIVQWIAYGNRNDPFTQQDVFNYHADVQRIAQSYKDRPGEFMRWQREMCRNDIYYLGVFVLGFRFLYVDDDGHIPIMKPWIFNRCKEVQESPDYHVDIWAREHFKSTIITLLKTIQDILIDPEIAICIYSYNSSISRTFVRQIRENMENPKLMQLFPDIIPDNPQIGKYTEVTNSGKKVTRKFSWSDEGFTVKRKSKKKEMTVQGFGLVNAQPTGYHFNLMVYDDVVTPDSVSSPEQSQKTTERFKFSLNTGAGESVRIRIIGTYYSLRDTYFDIINPDYDKGVMGGSRFTLRKYPCMEGAYPVLYSYGYLENKKKNMVGFVWASQMICNPQESSKFHFLDDWISRRIDQDYIEKRKDEYNFYILVDPANTKTKDSDYTAMWVVAAGNDRNYYFPDLIYDKLLPTERRDRLFELVNRWTNSRRKPTVFYESNSMSSDSAMMMEEMKRKDLYFQLIAATTKPRMRLDTRASGYGLKFERIMALEPLYRDHRIVLAWSAYHTNWEGRNVNMIDEFINNEYSVFPYGKHDDGLDAQSRIADLETGVMISFPDRGMSKARRIKEIRERADIYDIDAGSYRPY